MRTPYTQLYVHVVWATWDRLPLITPAHEQAIYAAIQAQCRESRCEPIAIGGVPDHVHLLIRLHPTVCISDLIKAVKRASSHLMTHQVCPGEFFKWQGAYGAFTVSPALVDTLAAYVRQQKAPHAEGRLQTGWEQTSADSQIGQVDS
jgi:REP element-mobilizing transposase RayT